MKMFQYVPTRDLIHGWRLVSTKWSHFATEICRQRDVRLRLPRPQEIFSTPIAHLFSEDNPPFSAATLTLDCDMPECHAFSDYVTQRFGSHLKSARISTRLLSYKTFFDTIRCLPNLVTLEIAPQSEAYEYDDAEDNYEFTDAEIQLSRINHLKMCYEPESRFVRILEAVLEKLSPQLESIDLQLNTATGDIEKSEFKRCADLFAHQNFSTVSLGLPYEIRYFDSWDVLIKKGPLEIQTLYLSSHDGVKIPRSSNVVRAERFLNNCYELTSLTLKGFQKRSVTSKRFRIPALRKLKKLKISWDSDDVRENIRPISDFQFEPLVAGRFPSLTEVVIDCYACRGMPMKVDVRQLFVVNEGDAFLGVTSLDVGAALSETKWADAFPNVTKLSVVLESAEHLSATFENMTQVTELDIDVSAIVFGLMESINGLKKLQILTLRIDDLKDEVGVFATLLPVQLKIVYRKYKLVEYCLQILRNRHISVLLINEDCDLKAARQNTNLLIKC